MKRVTKIIICLIVVIGLKYTALVFIENSDVFSSHKPLPDSNETKVERYILETEGCKIPNYDPFDSTILKFYKKTTGDIPCTGKKYFAIENNTVVFDEEQADIDYPDDYFTCSYEVIIRNPLNSALIADNVIGYSDPRPLNFDEVMKEEFFKVSCSVDDKVVHEEYLATTPIKPSVANRCRENAKKSTIEPKVDVLIVGIDSVSKLNFLRHFSSTAEYLSKNLSAFEFHGYMKVADNTFPNLTPMLTGHFVEHYFNPNKSKMYFDNLDFVWKKYSEIGYKTFLGEDAPHMGIYNYAKLGFRYVPTDYYFRPFTFAIEDTKWQKKSNKDCYQANPEIKVLFDYLKSFLSSTGDEPYFALTWPSRLTHNHLNKAGYADTVSFELLNELNEMGIFNRSMVVFMSDHGIRFGPIRDTFLGKIEERMPFLFLTLPPWFLESYPSIEKNLKANQKRMVTPFDIYETFEDLLQIMSGVEPFQVSQYGISLFSPIPINRTCDDAFILPHWCPCHRFLKKRRDNPNIISAAKVLIQTINNWTEPFRDICEKLSFENITDARMSIPKTELLKFNNQLEIDGRNLKTKKRRTTRRSKKFKNKKKMAAEEKETEIVDYLITIRTLPGHSAFESTVRRKKDVFTVLDVSRINEYGHQGDCINDFDLRKYCFCK